MKTFKKWKELYWFAKIAMLAIWVMETVCAFMLIGDSTTFLRVCGVIILIAGTVSTIFAPYALEAFVNAICEDEKEEAAYEEL